MAITTIYENIAITHIKMFKTAILYLAGHFQPG